LSLALRSQVFSIFSLFFLNQYTHTDISTQVRLGDILVGLTIYLKTSVDFALFIGNLMSVFRGWKNRIMIELGTAAGNALGTYIILTIWDFFRDVKILLALMIFIAALVLLKLAEEGLEHTHQSSSFLPEWFYKIADRFQAGLHQINRVAGKPLDYIMPNLTMRPEKKTGLAGLFFMSFSIPFILGLDDFAGYVPVFDIINVYGFAIGVLVGHMVLNLFLFISPKKTIEAVKEPFVSFLGSIAFTGLAVWGFYEVVKILFFH
jgi:hypothetical protein